MRDNDANEEVKNLILGVVPERKEEFLELWNRYSPNPRIVDDNNGFRLEAGAYGIIQFEHKSLAQIWLFAYIVQLFFKNICEGRSIDEVYNLNQRLLSYLSDLFSCTTIEDFNWPKEIPKPSYNYKRNDKDDNEAMAFDLCCMAGAFFFLHEFSHLKINHEQSILSIHEEEFECDNFAVEFMLSRVLNYAQSQNYDVSQTSIVKQKRAMGIILGLAFILKTTKVKDWYGTESHPSVIDRIKKVLENLNYSEDLEAFWKYLYCIFSAVITNIPLTIDHTEIANNMKSLGLSLIDNIDNYAKEQASMEQ